MNLNYQKTKVVVSTDFMNLPEEVIANIHEYYFVLKANNLFQTSRSLVQQMQVLTLKMPFFVV